MGGHLGFTFHWPVSIPDMEIEFTGQYALSKLSCLLNQTFKYADISGGSSRYMDWIQSCESINPTTNSCPENCSDLVFNRFLIRLNGVVPFFTFPIGIWKHYTGLKDVILWSICFFLRKTVGSLEANELMLDRFARYVLSIEKSPISFGFTTIIYKFSGTKLIHKSLSPGNYTNAVFQECDVLQTRININMETTLRRAWELGFRFISSPLMWFQENILVPTIFMNDCWKIEFMAPSSLFLSAAMPLVLKMRQKNVSA